MKSLELTQMELIEGGNRCSNAANLFIGASLITGAIVGGLTFGIGAVIGMGIATAAMANCQNGWADELIG